MSVVDIKFIWGKDDFKSSYSVGEIIPYKMVETDNSNWYPFFQFKNYLSEAVGKKVILKPNAYQIKNKIYDLTNKWGVEGRVNESGEITVLLRKAKGRELHILKKYEHTRAPWKEGETIYWWPKIVKI